MFEEVEKPIKENKKTRKEIPTKISVLEYLNKKYKIDRNLEQWKNWSYLNKITPCEIMEEDGGKQLKRLGKLYLKRCDGSCVNCLDNFFSEVING